MSLGYVFLILALLSTAGLGICHKLADLRDCKPGAINVMLFCAFDPVLGLHGCIQGLRRRGQSLSSLSYSGGAGCSWVRHLRVFRHPDVSDRRALRSHFHELADYQSLDARAGFSVAVGIPGMERADSLAASCCAGSGDCFHVSAMARQGSGTEKRSPSEKLRSNMWYRWMFLAFVTNGLSAFGARVLKGMGLAESHGYLYLSLWYTTGLVAALALFAISAPAIAPARDRPWRHHGRVQLRAVGSC